MFFQYHISFEMLLLPDSVGKLLCTMSSFPFASLSLLCVFINWNIFKLVSFSMRLYWSLFVSLSLSTSSSSPSFSSLQAFYNVNVISFLALPEKEKPTQERTKENEWNIRIITLFIDFVQSTVHDTTRHDMKCQILYEIQFIDSWHKNERS